MSGGHFTFFCACILDLTLLWVCNSSFQAQKCCFLTFVTSLSLLWIAPRCPAFTCLCLPSGASFPGWKTEPDTWFLSPLTVLLDLSTCYLPNNKLPEFRQPLTTPAWKHPNFPRYCAQYTLQPRSYFWEGISYMHRVTQCLSLKIKCIWALSSVNMLLSRLDTHLI